MIEPIPLQELSTRPVLDRMRSYARLTGPGYLQSAMTLGGGTVASCVLLGSMFGYELLWVQPLAIVLGAAVLAAVAKQTCHTQEKPYGVFWRRLHPALALLWGLSALVATIIWHFPQYSLSANGVTALLSGAGLDVEGLAPGARLTVQMLIGVAILALCAWVVRLYEAGAAGLRGYEIVVKYLVWAIVIAFGVVAIASGIDLGEFVRGVTGISFLERVSAEGLPAEAIRPVVGGLAAAVGINMVFLYPYSLLRKQWGPAHTELAYFDLAVGMVLPFLIATTCLIVATAATIGPAPGGTGPALRNILDLVPVLGSTFGSAFALILIGGGMLAVGVSTIITHMLASAFIGSEILGRSDDPRVRRWCAFLPAIGIAGVAYPFPWALSVTASTLAYPLMPVAVICFVVLLNRKDYMGRARPEGAARLAWNLVLGFAVVFMIAAAWLAVAQNWADLRAQLGSG